MNQEFDRTKDHLSFSVAREGEDVEKKARASEEALGMKDYHVIVHINPETAIRIDTFVMTAIVDGGLVFLGNTNHPARDSIHLLRENIIQTVHLIWQVLAGLREEKEKDAVAATIKDVIEELEKLKG